ncbi:unnamed protein product [Arctogadus glacialis]
MQVVGPGICLRRAAGFLNVILERRRAGGGAVNLEDDHHSTNKDYQDSGCGELMEEPRLWRTTSLYQPGSSDKLRLQPDQESGGLMEKPYIWKANPEDDQDSTIKDSSHA